MKLFAGSIFFLLIISTLAVAAPIHVERVQVEEFSDGSQVVFELSAPANYHSFLLDNPPRLVVDLRDTRLLISPHKLKRQTRDIRAVRTGIRGGVNLRVVLDLTNFIRSEVYLLRSADNNQHRLVMDVYRHQKPASYTVGVRGSASRKDAGEPARRALAWSGLPVSKDYIVAIDPGHGGKDPGAVGPRNTQEKRVVLQIARRLQKLVNREPGMRAILTRYDDSYLRLYERIEVARQHQADLFISIHADAFTHPEARGSSVYILSTRGASSAAARWLANHENASDLIGGARLEVKDPELMPVVFDIYHDAILADSLVFADKVLDQLGEVGNLHNETVERAAFAVLKSPDIPSILVETAFISNPREEAKLRQSHYQQKIAQAVMSGIRAYFANRPPKQEPYLIMAESSEPVSELEEQRPKPVSSPGEQKSQASPTKLVDREIPLQTNPQIELQSLQLISKSTFRQPSSAEAARVVPAVNRQVHVIRRGESLADIANHYSIDVSELRSANHLSHKQLRMPAGTALTIPVSGS